MASPVSPAHEQFGQRVRDRRHEQGWTQEKLAEHSGLHYSYVAQVERGERNISLTNILILARALDTDAGALVEGLLPGS